MDRSRPAGLSSGELSHLTRENFRQTHPIIPRGFFGTSANTPEKSKPFKNFHEHEPRLRPTEYSRHNRRNMETAHHVNGGTTEIVNSEGGRVWRRVRANVPGSGSYRFYFEGQRTPSKVNMKTTPKANFREAIKETANLDAHHLRYDLPSERDPSKHSEEQQHRTAVQKTTANQNHVFARYHVGNLPVGKRHVANPKAMSQTIHVIGHVDKGAAANDGVHPHGIIASQRRQRIMMGSSSVLSAPSYPTKSKHDEKIAIAPGKVSLDALASGASRMKRTMPAGKSSHFFDA